jgi:hypothetical protein
MATGKKQPLKHYKAESELRIHRVQVRLTTEEHAILRDIAKENKVTDSRVIILALNRYFALIQKKPR